jgi:hypothetical protein
MKKFFCFLLGHTWVPAASNPKTSWNVGKDAQTLIATPAAEVHFYNQCARCGERREIRPGR